MGDRYVLTVKCKCGFIDNNVWYAPTCGFMIWECPKCKRVVNLEKYSGIDAEGCANTEEGIRAVRKLKKKLKKSDDFCPSKFKDLKVKEVGK
jgi:hypothetical protein